MCGIGLVVWIRKDSEIKILNESSLKETEKLESIENERLEELLEETLKRRGNDLSKKETIQINENIKITLFGTLLSLRGDQMVGLPYKDSEGNVLCWNGEIFSGEIDVEENQNDTQVLAEKLKASEEILECLEGVDGPYSFIYFHKKTNKIFISRDLFGRRSLVYRLRLKDHQRENKIEEKSQIEQKGFFFIKFKSKNFKI